MRYALPKRLLTFNGLHGVISQDLELLITTAVRTSNPTGDYLAVKHQLPLTWNQILNHYIYFWRALDATAVSAWNSFYLSRDCVRAMNNWTQCICRTYFLQQIHKADKLQGSKRILIYRTISSFGTSKDSVNKRMTWRGPGLTFFQYSVRVR
jgi:hypothetical protein